jgi:hypothetical protein
METPRLQVQQELLLAKQSRREGNEGRARVCARRAAGAAVQLYLDEKGLLDKQENAIQALETLRQMKGLPVQVMQAVDWLLKRVNIDYNLPPEVDLIQEACIVIGFVEGEEIDSRNIYE